MGGWKACKANLSREWRKRLDPKGFAADTEWLMGVMKEHRQQADKKHRIELAQAGLENFQTEILFRGWENHIAPEILKESRQLFQRSIDKLGELGEKASRTEKENI